ncbi:MAG: ABC transporter ATP-binding protein [Calditrichaeota bacterium]|nr:ABC transporter ATP-binding protein [Calditrichota bacterium]RQV92522.1 MAG: ABC transporter ATP-binding protein [bacterium]
MPDSTTFQIQVVQLTKRYREPEAPAVNNVSFNVQAGEKIGIVGANGSGKTTLFRLLLNLLHPDSGTILIKGNRDIELEKVNIGFVAEHQEGLENFTPEEILYYAGKMSGLTNDSIQHKIRELLRWSDLEKNNEELLGGFSKGMRQRLFLSVALMHEPGILLLDEPMSGLDPRSQKDFSFLLQGLKAYTILYASHQLSEIEELCQRVLIFQYGRLIQDILLPSEKRTVNFFETTPAILSLLEKNSEIDLLFSRPKDQNVEVKFLCNAIALQNLILECQRREVPIHQMESKTLLEDLYDQFVKDE